MKLTQLRQVATPSPRVEGSAALSDGEALHAFDSEAEAPRDRTVAVAAETPKFMLRIPVGSVVSLAIVGTVGLATGAASMWLYQRAVTSRAPASLKIETSAPGIEVLVGGKAVGRTPLLLALPPGSYPIQLAGQGARRDFTVELAGGATVVRHVDLGAAAAARPDAGLGSLLVQTEPSRLQVSVDGEDRGASPLTLTGLTPGEHQVAVRRDGATVRRTVTIKANEHTVLVVSPVAGPPAAPPPNAAGGWLALSSPLPLTIREGGKVLGSTDSERLMLPAGEHSLELTNETLGFQSKRTVRIEPGRTATLKVEPPSGTLSINAQPWAEVWVDGKRIGETPIGKFPQTIGTHEVVLRHPELGERRETVTVTVGKPARLGVDMRRK